MNGTNGTEKEGGEKQTKKVETIRGRKVHQTGTIYTKGGTCYAVEYELVGSVVLEKKDGTPVNSKKIFITGFDKDAIFILVNYEYDDKKDECIKRPGMKTQISLLPETLDYYWLDDKDRKIERSELAEGEGNELVLTPRDVSENLLKCVLEITTINGMAVCATKNYEKEEEKKTGGTVSLKLTQDSLLTKSLPSLAKWGILFAVFAVLLLAIFLICWFVNRNDKDDEIDGESEIEK